MVDNEDLYRALCRQQLQPKLVLNRCIERWDRIQIIGGPVAQTDAVVPQRKVIFAGKPSLIRNGTAKLFCQHTDDILHGAPVGNEIKPNITIALLVKTGYGLAAPALNLFRAWWLVSGFSQLRSILR